MANFTIEVLTFPSRIVREINSFYCHPIPALYDVITALKINEVIRLIKRWPSVEKRLTDRRHQRSFDFRARAESGFSSRVTGGKN